MTTVVEISDNEDFDDCVIKSVEYLVDDSESDLCREVRKENQLLADFIEKCLKLENSKSMLTILKEEIVKHYYEVDKVVRESPRLQKNLRRANYLLYTDPKHKFSHIKDLCNILKALKVKKKVPFVTLTTNLTANISRSSKDITPSNTALFSEINSYNFNDTCDTVNDTQHESIIIETCSQQSSKTEDNLLIPITDGPSGINKNADLYCANISSFTEDNDNSIGDTLDESTTMESCSQQSSVTEDKLLIPKQAGPFVPTPTDKAIKVIENKITYYKNKIAYFDQLEVDDDSENSPYIKSERLKTKIVSLYKERCQLMGSQLVKRKGIRLKLAEGHPPGPTRALERFLNTNFNKDGDPPFPDFCDVVTCVTEANEKDDLGWTKAQILNEASSLFTLCGRALQKRRQNREYRDLVYKVKLEDLEKDPADEDPELKAKLEENKRVAVKKEADILERYTMLQYLPPKPKSQKKSTIIENTGNNLVKEHISEVNPEADVQQELVKNNNCEESLENKPVIDKNDKKDDSVILERDDKNFMDVDPKSSSNEERHELRNLLRTSTENVHNCSLNMEVNITNGVLASILPDNVKPKIVAVEHCSNLKETVHSDIINNGANHIIKTIANVENRDNVLNSISNKDRNLERSRSNIFENQILRRKKRKSKQGGNVMDVFKRLGDNFTLTVEIMSDS